MNKQEIEDLIIYEGVNKRNELSVIVLNLENEADILYKTYPEIVNVYPMDAYEKCDGCMTIVTKEETTIIDGEVYCQSCKNNLLQE